MRDLRLVFCPHPTDFPLSFPLFSEQLYAELRKRAQVAFLALTPDDLDLGAKVDSRTFYTGVVKGEPHLLRHADGVVTFDARLARTAKQLGIPTILLGHSALVLRISALTDLIFEEIISQVSHSAHSPKHEGRPISFCSIADWNYLPHWVGLMRNLEEVSKAPIEMHLLALDDKTKIWVRTRFPRVTTYRLADVWSAAELDEIEKRPIPFQAFSSKPAIIKAALTRTKAVTFADTDLYFFESPERFAKALSKYSVVLCPQFNDDLRYARSHGLFNTGLITVRKGAENFLEWWRSLCLWKCSYDTKRGFFVDQGFIDAAPLFFENFGIYRAGDENVGGWNLETLGVTLKDGKPRLSSGKPVRSFHAAISDPLGLFEWKVTWDQIHAFAEGLDSESLTRETIQHLRRYWPSLSFAKTAEHTFRDRYRLPIPGFSKKWLDWWVSPKQKRVRHRGVDAYQRAKRYQKSLRSS